MIVGFGVRLYLKVETVITNDFLISVLKTFFKKEDLFDRMKDKS